MLSARLLSMNTHAINSVNFEFLGKYMSRLPAHNQAIRVIQDVWFEMRGETREPFKGCS